MDDEEVRREAQRLEQEAVGKAIQTIFRALMRNGNNFMAGYILADGWTFKVKIEISEVREDALFNQGPPKEE